MKPQTNLQTRKTLTSTLGMILSVCVSLAGCAGESINVSEVLNHHQCQELRSGLSQIKQADLAKIRGVRLLTPPDQVKPANSKTDEVAATNTSLLIAVSNGSQPSSGYGFVLNGASAQGKEVRLDYAWQTPAADAVVAQVITSPCSVVQVDNVAHVGAVSAWLDGDELDRIDLQPH